MNRAGSPGPLGDNPIGAKNRSPDKKRAAAQVLGQAYITAYALMDANREGLEKIADALVEGKEIYGDEARRAAGLGGPSAPASTGRTPATWPTV